MVDVLLGKDILIHVVDSITNHFPRRVGRDLKLHRILLIVEEAVGAFQFHDLISAQGQFFGGFHAALAVGIEHVGFLGWITAAGIDHGQALFGSILMQHIDGERGVGQFDCLAGFGIHLDQFQITFHFLIEDVISQVTVAGFGHTSVGLAHDALRSSAVHRKAKGIALEYIFRDGGLNDKILPIGKASHSEHTFLVGEDLTQTILIGRAGGHPAETAAVGIVARFSQGRIVGIHQIGVAFEHPRNGLGFAGEIILQSFGVVIVLAVGVQHALDVVATVRVAGKLICLAQIGDAVNGEACTFQLGSGAARAGGAHQLAQFEAALQHCIQAVLTLTDHIPGLITIGQGLIVVDLIAEVPLSVAQVVSIIGFAAVQRTALCHGGVQIFVDVVGILTIGLLQRCILASRLQLAVQLRILSSDVELAVGIHRQDNARSPLHQIVPTKIKISEHQLPILDLGAGHQMVFGKNGKITLIPAIVGTHSGMPDRLTTTVHNLAVINHPGHTVRMLNIRSRVKIVHGPFDAGFTVRCGTGYCRAAGAAGCILSQLIQI